MSTFEQPVENQNKELLIIDDKTVESIRDRIMGDEMLESVLALYDGTAERSETPNPNDMAYGIRFFLSTYPDLETFKNTATPDNMVVNKVLAKYPDLKEATQAFKTIIYGKNGEISYMEAPLASQEADTQELPVASGESRNVETLKNYDGIIAEKAERVLADKRLKGILAEYALGKFSKRDDIDETNASKLVKDFLRDYPTQDDFAQKGNVPGFINNIAVKNRDGSVNQEETEKKQSEYRNAMIDFNDIMYR